MSLSKITRTNYPRLQQTAFFTWWIGTLVVIPMLLGATIPGVSLEIHLLLAFERVVTVSPFCASIILLIFFLSKKLFKNQSRLVVILTNLIAILSITPGILLFSFLISGDINPFMMLVVALMNVLIPLVSGLYILLITALSRLVYRKFNSFLRKPQYAYFGIPFIIMIIFTMPFIILGTDIFVGVIPYAILACLIYAVLAYKKIPIKQSTEI